MTKWFLWHFFANKDITNKQLQMEIKETQYFGFKQEIMFIHRLKIDKRDQKKNRDKVKKKNRENSHD